MDVRTVSDPVFHHKTKASSGLYSYLVYDWLTLIANSPGSGEGGWQA